MLEQYDVLRKIQAHLLLACEDVYSNDDYKVLSQKLDCLRKIKALLSVENIQSYQDNRSVIADQLIRDVVRTQPSQQQANRGEFYRSSFAMPLIGDQSNEPANIATPEIHQQSQAAIQSTAGVVDPRIAAYRKDSDKPLAREDFQPPQPMPAEFKLQEPTVSNEQEELVQNLHAAGIDPNYVVNVLLGGA